MATRTWSKRILWALVAILCLGLWAACDLGPQPEPPFTAGDNNNPMPPKGNADASVASAGGEMSPQSPCSGDAGTDAGADAATCNPGDAGTDAGH